MRRTLVVAAGLAVGVGFALPALADSPHPAPGGRTGGSTVNCADPDQTPDTITYAGPTLMWPPNHKEQSGLVTATGDPNDQVSLTVTVTHEEILADGTELNGTGNTPVATDGVGGADTGTGSAEVPVSMRSERAGGGDGRVYTIHADATFNMVSCSAEWTVDVPHDMRPENRGA